MVELWVFKHKGWVFNVHVGGVDWLVRCSFCGDVVVSKCPLCGRFVCSLHYDVVRGLCVGCVEALCEFCGGSLSIARCVYCSRLGCDRCLTQLDNVRRACRECMDRRGLRVEEARRGLERLRELTLKLYEGGFKVLTARRARHVEFKLINSKQP